MIRAFVFILFKEARSVTMNIFRFFFYFLFISFVKIELSYVFTINILNETSKPPVKKNIFFNIAHLLFNCLN